ncbi:bacillithiol system redox-active protein YtxJ [Hymenobacter bucti]|uniref:Bacillithiol system redox-active protein YtxJ n=1 Tax=Hymenobacter bucti TaxID=1844114 RepID=A0ABW4QWM9_9BACT
MATSWLPLTQPDQLTDIVRESHEHPVIIFKHSTTCSISATAKAKLERQWPDAALPEGTPLYYLDLLRFRPISAQIAQEFGVQHESPQLLLIQDGKCTYHASHMGIRLADVAEEVK